MNYKQKDKVCLPTKMQTLSQFVSRFYNSIAAGVIELPYECHKTKILRTQRDSQLRTEISVRRRKTLRANCEKNGNSEILKVIRMFETLKNY